MSSLQNPAGRCGAPGGGEHEGRGGTDCGIVVKAWAGADPPPPSDKSNNLLPRICTKGDSAPAYSMCTAFNTCPGSSDIRLQLRHNHACLPRTAFVKARHESSTKGIHERDASGSAERRWKSAVLPRYLRTVIPLPMFLQIQQTATANGSACATHTTYSPH